MKKSFSRLLGVGLSLALLAGTVPAVAAANEQAQDGAVAVRYATYDGHNNGNDGTSESNASSSILRPLLGDYSGSSAMTIKVIQPDDVYATSAGADNTQNKPRVHVTPWHDEWTGWSPNWGIPVTITSADPNTKSWIARAPGAGQTGPMQIMGPTIFDNVVLIDMYGGDQEIETNGRNVTFEEGVEFWRFHPEKNWSDEDAIIKDGIVSVALGSTWGVDASFPGGTVIFRNAFTSTVANYGVNIPTNTGANVATFEGDETLEFDNAAIQTNVNWGAASGGNQATFNSNFNYIVSKADVIDNRRRDGNVNISGALQVIANTNATWKVEGADAEIGTLPSNVTVNGGTWILKKGNTVNLHTTETAGTFTVDGGAGIIATNDATGETIASEDGILTVPEGTYTITLEREDGHSYYITYGGTGDGRTFSNPSCSVQQVAQNIKADKDAGKISGGDTVTIYVIQPEDWNTVDSSNTKHAKITPWHTYSSWAYCDWNMHDITLHVTSYDKQNPSYLSDVPELDQYGFMVLASPVIFSDIVLVDMRNAYNMISLNHNNVTFGEGTVFAHHSGTTWDGTIVADGTVNVGFGRTDGDAMQGYNRGNIVFENELNATADDRGVHISTKKGNETYNGDGNNRGDAEIEFNNSAIKTNVYWGSNDGAKAITFATNLNFIVSDAELINNRAYSSAGAVNVNGALQIIANTNAEWQLNGAAAEIGALPANVNVSGGKYVLKINSEIPGVVRPTGTAGTFSVANGFTALATNDENGTAVASENGVLTVGAGTWNVIFSDDNYYFDGTVFTSFGDIDFDLSSLDVVVPENKLFIGWGKDEQGNDWYYDSENTFVPGEKAYACFVDFDTSVNGDLSVIGAQIRLASETASQGLRFVTKANKSLLDSLYINEIGGDNVSYGTIILPQDLLTGELAMDTADVGIVPAVNTFEETEDHILYTAVLTDIDSYYYDRVYVARSYIQYVDNTGILRTAYGESYGVSISAIAKEALSKDADKLTEEQKAALRVIAGISE